MAKVKLRILGSPVRSWWALALGSGSLLPDSFFVSEQQTLDPLDASGVRAHGALGLCRKLCRSSCLISNFLYLELLVSGSESQLAFYAPFKKRASVGRCCVEMSGKGG